MAEIYTNKKYEAEDTTSSSPVQEVIETTVNTDGRKPYDWESKYTKEARSEMLREAIYIGIVLALYFFSGLMGGDIFGIKYFYRVVARGYWTQDRKYWRVFSPWISACVALVVGGMVVSGYVNTVKAPSAAAGLCVGFIAGYFADEAVGKMSEVATALFGSNSKAE